MNLRPLADKIVVKMQENEESTSSGIILTSATKTTPQIAEVIAVGPGGMVDGKEVYMTVSVGDKVVLNKYSSYEVKYKDEEYIIVKMSDVLAIVE